MEEKNEIIKRVEEKPASDKKQDQLFDNPLMKDFVRLEHLKQLIPRKDKWFKIRMADGRLPCIDLGRGEYIFYVPYIRQAILENRLAPINRKVHYDRDKEDKTRSKIYSQGESERGETLEELRREKRRREVGEFY